ncbi:Protein of unknown function DUF1676 [Cinara cedri]|uniref:Uncharacterized protein n=1 Tax=Cinara cedri TaxID=506608 RepID=A0A5E4N281_9HEMI|nr:Protein of unknown function DUF1676 [Cinara cedri]
MSSPNAGVSFICAIVVAAACGAVGDVSSLPRQRQHPPELDGGAGIGAALWSAVTGCLGPDSIEPAAVCFKSKALTVLDRTLAESTAAIANGVSLSCRAGRSPQPDHSLAAEADRAALNAAGDPDRKNALLDRMIADRMDALVATRTIVLQDGSVVQEGRGKKKQQKTIRQAFMMAGLMAVAILVPMAFSFVALFTTKALLVSKIALVASSILAFKKLLQPSKSSAGGGHKIEIVPEPHYVAHEPNAHNTAYSSYAK